MAGVKHGSVYRILTYCHPLQQQFQIRLIFHDILQDFFVFRDVDKNRQSVLSYLGIVLDEKLEVLDRLELIAFEEPWFSCRISEQLLCGCML